MLIQVSAKGFEMSHSLREEVERKLSDSLERIASGVEQIHVFLADENGPKKGVDKSIRVVLEITRKPSIVIHEKGEDWHALIASMCERAARAVNRQRDRQMTWKGRVRFA
jgi:ribosome-associated translation inhibitor RaiA